MRQYANAFTRNLLEKARFYSLVKTKNNIMITENHNTYCTCSLLICVSEGLFFKSLYRSTRKSRDYF